MGMDDVLKEYPQLKKMDVLAALDYATQVLRHEEVYPTAKVA